MTLIASDIIEPKSRPFASVKDIKLGMIVRDPSTGLTGQADSKAELMSGCTQYTIQPMGDGKTVPERYFVDDFLLEYVGVGVSDRVPAPDENAKFLLGEKLQDTVTGYMGIATQKTTHLNGCVHYHLQANMADQKGKKLFEDLPQGATFDHKRLSKLSEGVVDKVPKKASKTGGPITKAARQAVPR